MNRVGVRRKKKVGVCCMCRSTFQSSRWDKKTCSATCRKRWERFTKKQDEIGSVTVPSRSQDERLNNLMDSIASRVFAKVK